MKDSSVGPVGLLDPSRQRRLLDALASRCHDCAEEQDKLQQQHQLEAQIEESSLADKKAATTEVCRNQRREMLMQWDAAEEQLTANYEIAILRVRSELGQINALIAKKQKEGVATIERKVEARKQAILHQYNSRKDQPGEQRDKEISEINASLNPIYEEMEWISALTIRRLDRLPDVPPASSPEEDMREKDPTNVRESTDTIYRLIKKCKTTAAEMQSGAASKIVDSFWLPGGVAVFIVIWAICALAFGPAPPALWLWMAGGVPVAGVIGFTIYAILLWPLKRMTRRLYPQAVRIQQAAEECAEKGRKISTEIAEETSRELEERRDAHLVNAVKWRGEQLETLKNQLQQEKTTLTERLNKKMTTLGDDYETKFSAVRTEMHGKAETLAQQITSAINNADQSVDQQRQSSELTRKQQMQRLQGRLKMGVSRGVHRITSTADLVQERFPSWGGLNLQNSPGSLDYLPIGSLQINQNIRSALTGSNGSAGKIPAVLQDHELPNTLPVVLHRRSHSSLVINAHHSQMTAAIDAAHHVLWRLLTGVTASRAKLMLIDPLGRGQHFTSFMALADHDPTLVGHRVWTTDNKIDERLGELAHHIEDVLQTSLRDRFERIEDYNEVAGAMAEPYRAVCAVGFPESLTRTGYKHLRALIESGSRCGIFTILVCDQSRAWPSDMPLPETNKSLHVGVDEEGNWSLKVDGLEHLPFTPGQSPPPGQCTDLVEKIGIAAVAASKVEIPLSSVLPEAENGTGSTDDEIRILVGSQGANRTLSLELGEGVRQHVLIAGKTGSGKSTLLHSIITSGAYHYRPDQLEFYLLDFKKGVEFKPYADMGIPHARVIGIESEREFGRSVLQRLDTELQQRGERFRAAGVQNLGAFRQATGESLARIMLVIDEFQEIFVRDDKLANDCAMLLDRLVRQGRSFGIHVVLSSQSLAGAYSLPRATLGQMAVRIAMQCSESDAALILSDDNTAARLLSRPGEAIYNDAGGLVEGNQPFQVAWLSNDDHQQLLQLVGKRDEVFAKKLDPPVIFEGNRPCRWSPAMADAASRDTTAMTGLLGEAVEIGPPLSIEMTRNAGRNLLVITPSELRGGVVASLVAGFAKTQPGMKVMYFDGVRRDDGPSMVPWCQEVGIDVESVPPRDSEKRMVDVQEMIVQRGEETEEPPLLLIIDPLERFRDLRQDDTFNFSLESPAGGASGAQAFRDVLRDGPGANVFTILFCAGAETLGRWLPRSSHHDLEMRILGRMNAGDSSLLIDSPIASDLTTATMLLYDDSDGRITKFRQCDLPDAEPVKDWLSS